MDPEIEELPTDLMRGLDFNIRKTTKGQYADYSTSSWSRNINRTCVKVKEILKMCNYRFNVITCIRHVKFIRASYFMTI